MQKFQQSMHNISIAYRAHFKQPNTVKNGDVYKKSGSKGSF